MKRKYLILLMVLAALAASYGAGYATVSQQECPELECPQAVTAPLFTECDPCPEFECPTFTCAPCWECETCEPCPTGTDPVDHGHQAGSLNEIIDGKTR